MTAALQRRPLVSICVPAYKSQDFVFHTLNSACGQTVSDIEIIVSNDGAHRTPALDRFRGMRNIRIYQQPQRLGWVQNSNFALSMATGRYYMILPHDDVLDATYVEECLRILESEPQCFAAHSDIAMRQGLAQAKDILGPPEARVRLVMEKLYNGTTYRALMRRRPEDWERLKLRRNPPTDFCVDTTWILQQACLGEVRRVPKTLYRKRLPPNSTHSRWAFIPPAELRRAWAEHCRQMGEIASSVIPDGALVSELVSHRSDARNIDEAPPYLKAAMEG